MSVCLSERVSVGERDTVNVFESVLDGVSVGVYVEVDDTVGEKEYVYDEITVGVEVGESVYVFECVLVGEQLIDEDIVNETVGVPLGDGEGVNDMVTEGVAVTVRLFDRVKV